MPPLRTARFARLLGLCAGLLGMVALRRRRRAAIAVAVVGCGAGCNAVWGVDALDYGGGASGSSSSSTSTTSNAGGSGGSGALGGSGAFGGSSMRCGSYNHGAGRLRAAFRNHSPIDAHYDSIGLRCARSS